MSVWSRSPSTHLIWTIRCWNNLKRLQFTYYFCKGQSRFLTSICQYNENLHTAVTFVSWETPLSMIYNTLVRYTGVHMCHKVIKERRSVNILSENVALKLSKSRVHSMSMTVTRDIQYASVHKLLQHLRVVMATITVIFLLNQLMGLCS